MIGFHLSDVRIRMKLFLLLFVLIAVPFLLYSTVILSQVSRELEALGFRAAEQVLAQTKSYLESRVDLVKRSLDLLTLNSDLRDISVADPDLYGADPARWIRDARVIQQLEDTVAQNNPDIRSFVVYMKGGLGVTAAQEASSPFRSLDGPEASVWLGGLDPTDNLPQWFAPREGLQAERTDLTVFRRIPDDLDLQATVGWVRADLKIRGFLSILDQAQFSQSSAAFLIDQTQSVVALSTRAQSWPPEMTRDLARGRPSTWTRVQIEGGGWVLSSPIRYTDWSLVLVLSDDDIGAFGDRTRDLLFLALAVLGPLLVPLTLWAASSSTRRLESLLKGVRHLRDGRFDVILPRSGTDEIGELTENFNAMVTRIRHLLDEQYRLGLEVKHRELEVLQAQINPHFLYNALDLISGQAQLARQPQIAETVSALSRFYRLSLAGGADEVMLSREFDHARSYIAIQNLRFDGAVVLKVDLPEELAQVPVMKMLLQPLVENALLHGILERPSGRGNIALTARCDDQRLLLTVTDDGVGMAPWKVTGLLGRSRDQRLAGGYGITNIERRLQLRYGELATLRFFSQEGEGTTAEIVLPFPAPLNNPTVPG